MASALWLAKRDGGLTQSQQKEYREWRSANKRREKEIARLEATWSALQQLRDAGFEAILPARELRAKAFV